MPYSKPVQLDEYLSYCWAAIIDTQTKCVKDVVPFESEVKRDKFVRHSFGEAAAISGLDAARFMRCTIYGWKNRDPQGESIYDIYRQYIAWLVSGSYSDKNRN